MKQRHQLLVAALLLTVFCLPMRAQVYAEMLLSDKAKGHKTIQSLSVPGDVNVYDNLHHHGPAFESELVAYRVYFDHRQTVDIYGKRRKGLELEHTQFYPTPQDIADGYGDDVLWAGTTLSCGSFRGIDASNKPTFIQPVKMRTESVLEYGPERTVVEIRDEGWEYYGQTLDMVQHYTLEAGHRDVRVDIDITSDKPFNMPFCTGVLTFPKGDTSRKTEGASHSAASWGSNWAYGPKDTLNVQRYATVGTAVTVPMKYVRDITEDNENLIIVVGNKHPRKHFHMTYWLAFCSAAEEWEGAMHDSAAWFDWVDAWRKSLKE